MVLVYKQSKSKQKYLFFFFFFLGGGGGWVGGRRYRVSGFITNNLNLRKTFALWGRRGVGAVE